MPEGTSILIVDDSASFRQTLSLILKCKGYSVVTAGTGEEAIEAVARNSFCVTFMDVRMPRMNGLETFRRIREIRPKAVVMMMTAYAVEDLVQAALREGACGVLYKPLDIEKVLALIERAKR